MKALVVVDMQNDFISGSLGTEEAKLENILEFPIELFIKLFPMVFAENQTKKALDFLMKL